MHYNLFKAQIIGHIGSAEIINEGQESEVKKISVACNFGYASKEGEEVKGVDWVEVILNKKADMARYLKGRKVLVEGVPTVNAYVNKEGHAVGKQVIVAPRVTFQDAKPEAEPDIDENAG